MALRFLHFIIAKIVLLLMFGGVVNNVEKIEDLLKLVIYVKNVESVVKKDMIFNNMTNVWQII